MSSKSKPPVKPVPAAVFATTRPAGLEPYVPGDKLPLPDVIEKNSDSVWALWSDAVKQEPEGEEDGSEKESEAQPTTFLMDLHELPKDPDA